MRVDPVERGVRGMDFMQVGEILVDEVGKGFG